MLLIYSVHCWLHLLLHPLFVWLVVFYNSLSSWSFNDLSAFKGFYLYRGLKTPETPRREAGCTDPWPLVLLMEFWHHRLKLRSFTRGPVYIIFYLFVHSLKQTKEKINITAETRAWNKMWGRFSSQLLSDFI